MEGESAVVAAFLLPASHVLDSACNTSTMETLTDPMADLEQLYRQYETAVRLANEVATESVNYWAPAPPPLTLAAHS